jgi:phytoene dehydrogenase-like protein
MRLREQYDWLVLGDHPGALLSASLAARLGLSVLVLPFGPAARLFVSASGQHFDPEPNLLIGLSPAARPSGVTAGLLGACLKRLGVLASEEEFIQADDCFPHVVTPAARLMLAPDPARFASELKRELGKDSVDRLGLLTAIKSARPELERYWLDLPSRLTVDPSGKQGGGGGPPAGRTAGKPSRAQSEKLAQVYRRLGAQVRSTQKSAQAWFVPEHHVSDLARLHPELDLEDVCRGLWQGVASSGIHDPELPSLLHALALANSAASFRGGMTAYREFMLRLARRAGADIPPKTDCRRIFVEGGRLIGIQVSNHGNMIGTPAGVLGCSLEYATGKVTSSGASLFKKMRPAPRPAGWRFSISLTVHQEAIPALTPSRVVWQEKDAPSILIEIVDPADYGHKEPDHRILFVRTIVPFTSESLSGAYQRMIAARLFRQLTELFPFLEFHVRRVFPDFRSSVSHGFLRAPAELKAAPRTERDEFAEAYPFATLADVPESLRCYSDSRMGSRSGVEGLFVASGESFPELGSLGPTVAAVEAVAWLAHRSGLSGPFN